jgi:hypothetical protein
MIGLEDQHITMWWIAVGIGAVVLFVVIALLTLLVRLVRDIEWGVSAVWEMGKRVAANTATTWMLGQTAALAKEIKEEALIHDQFLSSKG